MVVRRIETGFEWGGTGKWLTGALAGAVGAIVASLILYVTGAFHPSEVGVEALGILFMPGAVFGLTYTAIVSFGRLTDLAESPWTGMMLGFVYGILFGLTTVVGGSLSQSNILASVAFGSLIGVVYALSPYTR